MTENMSKEENNDFPFPKFLQTINYFFPKEKGAPDIFTIDNLKKFSRYAPFLAFGIVILILGAFIRDGIMQASHPGAKGEKFLVYAWLDAWGFIISFLIFLRWIGVALLAKLARRSAMVPLTMSFVDVFRCFGGFFLLRILGFIVMAIWGP